MCVMNVDVDLKRQSVDILCETQDLNVSEVIYVMDVDIGLKRDRERE